MHEVIRMRKELAIAIEYIQSTKENCSDVKDVGDAHIACMNAVVKSPVIINGRIQLK